MNNILKFKGKSGSTTSGRFLQESSETLDFGADGEGRFELNEPTLTYAEYSATSLDNDWSNQELADLFRVKRLLNCAGVICDIDRGLTDEREPWCVFCDEGGEVFIHLCRIDGLYVLDSPSVEKPLRGADFNALVSDFTNRAVPKTVGNTPHENERHVLHFHRGRKVRLHPSALLSALIWTLFLASEELVLIANVKEPDPSRDDADGAGDSPTVAPGIDHANLIADAAHTEGPGNFTQNEPQGFKEIRGHASDRNPDTAIKLEDTPFKEVNGQQGLALSINAYAIGLSSIALAYGIMSVRMWQNDWEKMLTSLDKMDFDRLLSGEFIPDLDDEGLQQSDGTFLAALFEVVLSDELSSDLAILRDSVRDVLMVAQNAGQEGSETTYSAADLLAFQKIVDSDALVFSTPEEELLDPSDMAPELAKPRTAARVDKTVEQGNEAASNPSGIQIADLVLDNEASDALVNIFGSWQLYEASVNNTQVYTSFDLASSNDDTAVKLIEFVSSTSAEPSNASGIPDTPLDLEPSATASSSKLQMFDDKAQAFMNGLLTRSDNIDVLYHGGDLILIDLDAFKTEGARTYTVSWEFRDGSVISTVGLRADFEAFDLVT